ncbi:EamA/RhaT family transporter [Novosphingobium sp. G106]|uniref:EamA/RhaT family transporter n=1 Tax=Novosphingobium sp. G106 TaxID=2849500 RepID=UPI0020C2979F|nr:EamA/RhaT family transporter [Novosphingobium sp. G106]
MDHGLLWVPLTLVAAALQVVRNGAQANLTGKIGTLGATQVRFVFGLPFALLFLVGVLAVADAPLPHFTAAAVGWTVLGAVTQIGGTAMMLFVMHRRAFGVAYTYIKTEPVIVALLGVVLLGDHLPALAWAATGLVTAGVIFASVKPGEYDKLVSEGGMIMAGIVSGALTGLCSIAFRGAMEALPAEGNGGTFVVRALTVLASSLVVQTALLGTYLAVWEREAFIGSLREWRNSLGAGAAGAASSAFWFTAFSLTPASNVRTMSLIELPIVALTSGRLTGRKMAGHEIAGLAVVMGGVALLLYAHAA